MKIMHLGDLHIGKKVNGYSMIEEQKYILNKIIEMISFNKVEAVIIAGDVYDKTVPTPEAVEVFDAFLVELVKKSMKVFIISGNHDSQERLAFGRNLISKTGVYISPVFSGNVEEIKLEENISIYLLPYIKPVHVKKVYEEDVHTYNEAVKKVIEKIDVDENRINILVTHQFITGAITTESEEKNVGGIDNVGADNFEKFDYVALGHIHRPQKIYKETIRYSGSPLKYSFSECNHKKSVTIIDVKEKGVIEIKQEELVPKNDMREIKGFYEEIMKKENYEGGNLLDYIHITLLDEEEILDVISKLRVIYPNIMKVDYDNKRTRQNNKIEVNENIQENIKNPIEIFKDFYNIQNNNGINEEQEKVLNKIINEIWED